MFGGSDPRESIKGSGNTNPVTGEVRPPEYFEFAKLDATEVSALGTRTWATRGQNFTLVHTDAVVGETIEHVGDFEHVLLLTDDDASVEVRVAEDQVAVSGRALVVIPPGASEIRVQAAGAITRLFDIRDTAVAARAINAATYAQPDPRTAPLEPWPEPADGHRLRVYRVDDYPHDGVRFGTIFRTSSFMVNFLGDQQGPRDPEQLSPHHHDDFQQCSFAVEGEWVHHIRTPWGKRKSLWRDDEHQLVGSPSVTIIPPPTVHTSEAVGAGLNRLIDIFSPPREDFSQKPGWVLNADDYPAPNGVVEGA